MTDHRINQPCEVDQTGGDLDEIIDALVVDAQAKMLAEINDERSSISISKSRCCVTVAGKSERRRQC